MCNEQLWPLSLVLAEWTKIASTEVRSYGNAYWLRTADKWPTGYWVYLSRPDGGSAIPMDSTVLAEVRPAFYLNYSSVLFTSEASGKGMKSATTGGFSLVATPQASSAIKMTVEDNVNLAFTTTTKSITTLPGERSTLNYSGVKTGNRKSLSAVICEKTTDDILYYGRLEDLPIGAANSGTTSFTVPSDLAAGDYILRVFNEEVNGANYTDYASSPQDIELKVKAQVPVVLVTNIALPSAGEDLDNSGVCSSLGVDTTSPLVTWKIAGSPDVVLGTADYNTIYMASMTLAAKTDEYYFDEKTTAQVDVNGVLKEATITLNKDGTVTLTYTYDATDRIKLLKKILDPVDINKPNGTPKTVMDLGLPETVTIETEQKNVNVADVTWDLENLVSGTYDPGVKTVQTFKVKGCAELDRAGDERKTKVDENGFGNTIEVEITVEAGVLRWIISKDANAYIPKNLSFGSHKISDIKGPKGLEAMATADGVIEAKGNLKVSDYRGNSNGWGIKVTQQSQFLSKNKGNYLTGAQISVAVGNSTSEGESPSIGVGRTLTIEKMNTAYCVWGAQKGEGEGVSEANIDGFSINIPPSSNELADVYETILTWILSDAPMSQKLKMLGEKR